MQTHSRSCSASANLVQASPDSVFDLPFQPLLASCCRSLSGKWHLPGASADPAMTPPDSDPPKTGTTSRTFPPSAKSIGSSHMLFEPPLLFLSYQNSIK